MEKKIAIIDLGSNSVRLVIMKIFNNGSYKMIDQAKEMVRLSEGMGEKRILTPQAINRTIKNLQLFKTLIEAHRVDDIIAVATAAVRWAENQNYFINKVKRETGFNLRVLKGKEEAYYDYMGAINSIDFDDALVVDIGGGSTQLLRVEGRDLKDSISLPFGAVNLTERFLGHDMVEPKALDQLKNFLFEQFASISWLNKLKKTTIIGIGGTIRTLAKIDKKSISYPLEGLHNYRITKVEVADSFKKVTTTDLKGRCHIPGVNKERADIVAAGFTIINCLVEYLDTKKLIISGYGLREGVFFQEYFKIWGGNKKYVDSVLMHSINNILKNYDANLKHCFHVRELALTIFDQTNGLHCMGDEERKILEVGSLLHDIGMYVDYYNHHKHGFYLVLNSRINGLTNKELVMTAYIVGMHRNREEIKEDWKHYKLIISKQDYETIKKLSIILKIAENLDRYGFGHVDALSCNIKGDTLEIKLKTNHSAILEITDAMKNEKNFEKLFSKKLVLV